ncbi:MAG: alpha/beta hydrolase [Pseudomonadota bacterium]
MADGEKNEKQHIRPLEGLGGEKPPAPDWFKWALDQPSDEGSVEVEKAVIRYSAWGEIGKPGLLFIHGGRAHRNWWRPFAPFFTERFRVAALDISGLGDSEWRPRYSMEQLVNEAFAVIEDAGLDRAGRPIVVGHSFGGYVTLASVERFGERLAGAVVVDSPVGLPDPDEGYTVIRAKPEEEQAKKQRSKRVYASLAEPIERFRFLPNQPCTNLYLVDYIAREGLTKAPMEGGAGWTWKFDPYQGANFDVHFDRDLLLAPRCPLAFVYGQNSAFTQGDGIAHSRKVTAGRSPLLMMPDAHHHLMMDQPIAFISSLRMLLSCWPIRVGA